MEQIFKQAAATSAAADVAAVPDAIRFFVAGIKNHTLMKSKR